jgi:hypothetical protein
MNPTKNKPKKIPSTMPNAKKKAAQEESFQLHTEPLISSSAVEDLSPKTETLPRNYRSGSVFLTPVEPRKMFTYWDLDLPERPCGQGMLRIWKMPDFLESEFPVLLEGGNYAFDIRQPGSLYLVEIGVQEQEGWKSLGRSNAVESHRETPSENTESHWGQPGSMNKEFPASGPDEEIASILINHLNSAGLSMEFSSNPEHWRDQVSSFLAEAGEIPGSFYGAERVRQLLTLSSFVSGEKVSLSSWFQAASSMWGGEWLSGPFPYSSSFSSFDWLPVSSWESSRGSITSLTGGGLWSASPISSWSDMTSWGPVPGSFFFHVNAELIFYGATVPGSRLKINNQEVALAADGSFRYHHRFPDGKFALRIQATSPDGQETRETELHFRRETKASSAIGQTPQPPLTAPSSGDQP